MPSGIRLTPPSGLTPLRFSHYQVKYEPQHVPDILSRTAANISPLISTHT